jgi:hypothetical protein
MKKISVCLDEAKAALVKQVAKANGMSTSLWVVDLIRKHASPAWPQDCLSLAGQFIDFPLREGSTASCSEDSYSAEPHANACK